MRGAWVYIVTNRPNGILYTGVTSNLARRAFEHRTGAVAGFTKRHGLKRLVWCEAHGILPKTEFKAKRVKDQRGK